MVATFDTAKTSPPELADAMVGRKVILKIDKGAAHPARSRSKRAILWCATIAAWCGSTAFLSCCAKARSLASRASPATASRNCSRRWPGIRPLSGGEILLEGQPLPRGPAQSAGMRGARHRPRPRGPSSRRPSHAVRGVRERHARLPVRARLRQGLSLRPQGDHRRRGPQDGGLRRQAAGAAAQDRQFLRRQPAEAGARPRNRAQPEDHAGRPADAGRRHRRDRVHSQAHRRPARRRQGAPAGFRRTRRDLRLSDRIIVLCGGHVTGERKPEETNPQDLGLLMAGVSERAA